MITKNEISSLNLSPTKKDFVQIWNELIEVASKITERWDPTSTNESDPGIVLLKVLAGIADKLNYNIDKNILEAFMPTAAQMESMRKLCELVGYDIKYYQSAETRVRISYTGSTTDEEEKLPEPGGLALPKFTTITNADKDITFVTTNTTPIFITNSTPWVEVSCIEGQISQCESINENNLITLTQLDDEYRYYLPEIQIAENGIFVYNAAISINGTYEDGQPWEQVSNLNTRSSETRVFKFGYDSFEGRPYLAFPEDVGSLIGDGLFIYFIRTSGLSGNISARTLEVLEAPTGGDWDDYSAEQFEVVNDNAATNGTNIESISAAYNNFKKTIGTFDTLVTCRDYMNKIYSLMDMNNTPYVSNILVTDIRNDINSAITLCSCNEFGILYKELPLTRPDDVTVKTTSYKVDEINNNRLTINTSADTSYQIEVPLIDHFDLVLYPFKTFTQVSFGTDKEKLAEYYNNSFVYSEQKNGEIAASLSAFKTCAHNFKAPRDGDLVAINNYLRLNALIATSNKVSAIEANDILQNVKVALINEFNMRNLDFGEEIPFDNILSVIENADSRIKVVSLQEPKVLTTFSVKETENGTATSKEYGIVSSASDVRISGVNYVNKVVNSETGEETEEEITKAKDIYNKLVLRNILAGRASLLDYDETFIPNNSEKPYTITANITSILNDGADELYNKDVADSINEAIDAIDADSDENLGEHILYDSDGLIITNGFYSNDSVITLKVFDTVKEEEYSTSQLESILDDEEAITAQNIMDEISNITTAGTHELTNRGLYGGTLVLIVSDSNEKKVLETYSIRDYAVYETYEPTFAVKQESAAKTRASSSSSASSDSAVIDKISRIAAICEITGDEQGHFEDITLAKNEVIKFRAPNLITTKTFPAYVYYRFERASGASGAQSASDGHYAAVQSLNSFISDVGVSAFFGGKLNTDSNGWKYEGLWRNAFKANPDNLKTKTATIKLKKLTDNTVEATTVVDVINQADLLPNIFNTSVACGIIEYVYTDGTITDISVKDTDIFTDRTQLERYLDGQKTSWGNTAKVGDTEELRLVITYFPFNEANMQVWADYVHTCYSISKGKDLPEHETTTFWRLSSTNEFPKGRLVTETHQCLYAQSNKFLNNAVAGATTYICTDHGENPIYNVIEPDSDIELLTGDKLYIHYTPSSTNEDGEIVNAEPISVVYEGGNDKDAVIIKPSGFTLMPSENVYQQGTSWKKTDVEFPGYGKKNLLALAPNEQIEMRSLSKVVIDKPARFYKNFDNAVLEQGNKSDTVSYELKDGEYIFYTDQNNQGAAYYGSGSVITLSPGAYIPKASEAIEVSEILKQGLHIVPWSNIVLLNADNGRTVTITEYQYVTLVEGDTLNTLTLQDADTINSTWKKCAELSDIFYTTSGAETSTELPKIRLKSGTWEVCSLLELSTSPGYAQQLRATDKLKNKINVYTKSGTGETLAYEIEPKESDFTNDYEKVSVKLSTIAKTASGNLEIKSESDNPSVQMKVFKEEAPAKVELLEHDDNITPISVKYSVPADASSDNINNYLTKIDVGELWRSVTETTTTETEEGNLVTTTQQVKKPNALKLNLMIPKNSDVFGIFSIYLEIPVDRLTSGSGQIIPDKDSRIFIDIPKEFGNCTECISIYNNGNRSPESDNYEDSWWESNSTRHPEETKDSAKNRLYLRAGLNCIKIMKSCSIYIKAEENATGSILYDSMRLVKGRETNGINLKLLDPDTTFNTEATQAETSKKQYADKILKGIASLDKNHDFYYNVPVENSLAIEFDDNINSFSNPYTLYDINNINNSFVVSKLDAAYLDTGLSIAKSSKY